MRGRAEEVGATLEVMLVDWRGWLAVLVFVFLGLALLLGAGLSEDAIGDVWLRP